MTPPPIRGACPRLSAPMPTGDGLLARLMPAGPISLDAFSALCAAARAHGNGTMEISARGSLQVRGLTPVSAPLFAAAVAALGIDFGEGVPVIAHPLVGGPLVGDPLALVDAEAVAVDLRRAIAAAGLQFAPKVSVIVDGGGRFHLDALTADIRLRAIAAADGPMLHVALGGHAASATVLGLVAPDDAADLVLSLLALIAGHGPEARARDLLRRDGISAFRTVAGDRLKTATPLAARPRAETIGLHRIKGKACAIGVALAFGQAQASDLIALAGIAQVNGAIWAGGAPDRTILFGPIGEMTGFVLATAADSLGFIVDARDPRRRIVACPGAPACASGLIAARALAAELAEVIPPQGDGIAVHVSGCAKGCAHSAPAPLTIVGTAQGCGMIRNGSARATPERYVDPDDLVTELGRIGERAKETVDA